MVNNRKEKYIEVENKKGQITYWQNNIFKSKDVIPIAYPTTAPRNIHWVSFSAISSNLQIKILYPG